MKKVYMINYDLYKTGQDYIDLINEIKKSPDHTKYLLSGWLIATAETTQQIYNRLSKWLDENDRILVNELTSNRQGWLNVAVGEWLRKYGL
ncbi:MAG: hypothetical protein WAZ36_00660 [Sediminibacterium sp.]